MLFINKKLLFIIYFYYLYIMTINIDKIYIINLEHRTDRLNQILNELNKMGLQDKGIRFNAIKNDFGALGCSMSHLNVLKDARTNLYNCIMILEDDFEFLISKADFEKKMDYIFNHMNFDVFMLGINLKKYNKCSYINIHKILNAQTASGYLVKNTYFDELINITEKSIPLLDKTHNKHLYAYDMFWKQLQPKHNWFCFKNKIGKQRSSYSDIEKRLVDYKL